MAPRGLLHHGGGAAAHVARVLRGRRRGGGVGGAVGAPQGLPRQLLGRRRRSGHGARSGGRPDARGHRRGLPAQQPARGLRRPPERRGRQCGDLPAAALLDASELRRARSPARCADRAPLRNATKDLPNLFTRPPLPSAARAAARAPFAHLRHSPLQRSRCLPKGIQWICDLAGVIGAPT